MGALLLCSCGKDHWVPRTFDPGDNSLEVRKGSHRVALLEDGRTALLYRLFLLRHAKHSIRIQTFILADDPIGVLVMEELVRAAQRGVTVQFLIDAMFTDVSPERLAMLSGINDRMEIRIYNPPTSQIAPNFLELSGGAITSWRPFNQRMHNKLLVVDDHVAICGGRNIADEYYDADFNLNFLDLDIVVEGPLVQDMSKSFKEYWDSPLVVPIEDMHDVEAASSEIIDKVSSPHISEAEIVGFEAERAHHEPLLRWHHVQHVAFWADPPHKPEPEEDPDAIARRLGALLAQTQEDLLIQSPYLVLSDQAIKVFKSLRERQVRIRVSTNSLAATDNWLSYAHSLRQRRTMLRDLKFQIYEMKPFPDDLLRYMPNYNHLRAKAGRISSDEPPGPPDPKLCLHTKALVIDKRISLVGTYNLDPRSARLNTENGVVIWDSSFAQYLSLKIGRDMDHANSWVVAKRFLPLPLEPLQMLIEEVNELVMNITSLDVWPLRYSSLFDLEAGMEPVPPDHPEFYERYRKVGLFPGVEPLDLKPILVELTRMLTGLFRPLI
jgi:putative cardiolipin synthase